VKSQRIGLGVAVVVLATCAVGFFIADGPRAALWPGLYAIFGGVLLYRLVRHPSAPQRWGKRRVIVSLSVVGPVTAVVVGVLVWVVLNAVDWPTRLIAMFAIALVPLIVLWGIQVARREYQAARRGGPAGTGDQQQ
jgi:hypothetical protein